MENILTPQAERKSKSARKDANRNEKIRDISNYFVLYLDPSDLQFWLPRLAQSDGCYLSTGSTGVHKINNLNSVIQYNSIKHSAICEWNTLGYSRFKKWSLSKLDRVHQLSLETDGISLLTKRGEDKLLKVEIASLVRTFWGREWQPELLQYFDLVHKSWFVALVVFDPDRTLVGY